MSTAQKILNLLNRESSSVSELASRLGISRNSVYVQLSRLEAAGAVEKVLRETASRAGKPAFQYRVLAGHEDSYSQAYKPVLGGLVEAMAAQLPEAERDRLLSEAGRLLARSSGLEPSADFEADFRQALDAVNTLGAMAECSGPGQAPTIRCHTCPIATLVHRQPAACRLVAAFFTEATGRAVEIDCRREDTVVCGFSFGEALPRSDSEEPSS